MLFVSICLVYIDLLQMSCFLVEVFFYNISSKSVFYFK